MVIAAEEVKRAANVCKINACSYPVDMVGTAVVGRKGCFQTA